MSEGIVNMNRPQFDRGVLCLSFGTSLALIQLSKYKNQAKMQRSKSAARSSRIVYIAITHMRISMVYDIEIYSLLHYRVFLDSSRADCQHSKRMHITQDGLTV